MKQTLPPLSVEELAHGERVTQRIRAELAANQNWLSFERYMEIALYEPGLGYYSAGARKLGHGGDFVTAPEVSPLFSRCLANQCAQVLATLGGGDVLELGAGSGIMAADTLAELARLESLPQRYFILEVSADLRARQRETLQARFPELFNRIEWLDALPSDFQGVLLANEVLDALPVQRFQIENSQVRSLGVTWNSDGFQWLAAPAEAELHAAVRGLEENLGYALPEGYVSEINLRLTPWLKSLADALHQGVMLWIDYGLPRAEYYSRERNQGTLLCHYRHQYLDDPFVNVGLQDIGAWVDFTAVADAALAAGLEVMGYTTQAHFLMGAGIDRYLEDFTEAGTKERALLAQQVQHLVMPNEMGERFKVLALSKNYEKVLSGFGFRDLRDRL